MPDALYPLSPNRRVARPETRSGLPVQTLGNVRQLALRPVLQEQAYRTGPAIGTREEKERNKMKMKKVGTVQTIDSETGKVISEKKNAMTLLGPPPDKCQVCATDHAWDQPHNQQSLYWQYHFYSEHGRWPTWTDAMQHCTPEVKAQWRQELVKLMKEKKIEIPADLSGQDTNFGR